MAATGPVITVCDSCKLPQSDESPLMQCVKCFRPFLVTRLSNGTGTTIDHVVTDNLKKKNVSLP